MPTYSASSRSHNVQVQETLQLSMSVTPTTLQVGQTGTWKAHSSFGGAMPLLLYFRGVGFDPTHPGDTNYSGTMSMAITTDNFGNWEWSSVTEWPGTFVGWVTNSNGSIRSNDATLFVAGAAAPIATVLKFLGPGGVLPPTTAAPLANVELLVDLRDASGTVLAGRAIGLTYGGGATGPSSVTTNNWGTGLITVKMPQSGTATVTASFAGATIAGLRPSQTTLGLGGSPLVPILFLAGLYFVLRKRRR